MNKEEEFEATGTEAVSQAKKAPDRLSTAAVEKPESMRLSESRFSMGSRLLGDKESARYLGISRSTLREYVTKGMLHRVILPHPSGYGVISRFLIDRQELDAFIEKYSVKERNGRMNQARACKNMPKNG